MGSPYPRGKNVGNPIKETPLNKVKTVKVTGDFPALPNRSGVFPDKPCRGSMTAQD